MAKRIFGLTSKDKGVIQKGITRAKNDPLGMRGAKAERRPQPQIVLEKAYFQVLQTGVDTIKILDGFDQDSLVCGNISVNKLAIAPVAVIELTIADDAYIYLECEGVYTADVLTSSINTIVQYADEQSWESGKEKILISRVLFAAAVAPATIGNITNLSQESVYSRLDIKGACQ